MNRPMILICKRCEHWKNFLLEYPGCILIVSHDRYFMDRMVDHLFAFEGEGVIRDFPGNYSQYREAVAKG
jgi:ATP-binding cassette subfamily F protein uup